VSEVAVWINNYGNAKHIAKAIESVLNQSYKDFTLYIFDNHSLDGADQIALNYVESNPGKVVFVAMPQGLAGIPAMKFGWEYISSLPVDYSITLGGHDYWPNSEHLATLVSRLDNERKAGNKPALVYTHTAQVNEDDQFVGQYANYLQSAGNMPLPFVPQWIISGIDCTPLFGLWNEEIRRQVPVRHMCAGWDHMVVAHAAVKGSILFDPRPLLVMRAPVPGSNMTEYGRKHFSPAALQCKERDFLNQIEWLNTMIEEATDAVEAPGLHTMLLTTSMFAMYCCLRGYNLSVFPGGVEAFNYRAQDALTLCIEAAKAIKELTR